MGFPASGSGRVHDLFDLGRIARNEIERRIFGPLPESENRYIKEYRDRLAVTFDTRALTEDGWGAYEDSDSEDDFHPKTIEPVNLNRTAVRRPAPPQRAVVDLKWFDYNVLFNSRTLEATKNFQSEGDKLYMRLTTRPNLIEQYISLVCGHANKLRRSVLPEDERIGRNGEEIVSCKWLPGAAYESIRDEFEKARPALLFNIRRALEAIDVTRENFETLDYLFIPVCREGHYVLYGFAPIQKKLFVINSFPEKIFQDDREYNRDTMLALLRYLVPKEDREQWDMDVDMVKPGLAANNREVNKAIMQRDIYNCGVFVATNVLLLAFGYNLKCYTARELDQYRKQRMIAELRNGGFTSLYNYDLIELPNGPPPGRAALRYRRLLEIHRQNGGARLTGGLDDSDGSSQGSTGTNEGSSEGTEKNDESDQEGDEDDNEARVLDENSADKPIKKKLPPRNIFPTATQCLAADIELGDVRPESIERPVDSQYDKRYGFLYPFYHVDFDKAAKCSKEEMIEACKNFPIGNWERNSFFEKDFFLDWMMNEMGATMSRIHKDPTPPFPGLGDGYDIWLKWNYEGKNTKSAEEVATVTSQEAEQKIKVPESTKDIKKIPAPIRTSPRTRKSNDEKEMASTPRTSPRLASKRIRLAEDSMEVEAEPQVVTVVSAMRERRRSRKRLDDGSKK